MSNLSIPGVGLIHQSTALYNGGVGAIQLPASSGVVISSLGGKLEGGQALVINGSGFGASETGSAAVTISPSQAAGAGTGLLDVGAVVQTGLTWGATQITIASADVTGMADGDTVYIFVTDPDGASNSLGTSVAIADIVLRVGSGVLADTIKDTDTGVDIASESLARMVVLSGNAGSTALVDEFVDATIIAGVLEYDDTQFNITNEGDSYLVAIEGASANRYGLLPATVVDRNDDP